MIGNKANKFLFIMLTLIAIMDCPTSIASISKNNIKAGIVNFGDPNVKIFKQSLHKLDNNIANHIVTLTQFGDSHSAADFFTGELRTLLQNKYGNAGIGWITPMYAAGQYHSEVTWKSNGWQLTSSRTVTDRDFPMGGYIADSIDNDSYIEVTPKNTDINTLWQAKLIIKPLHKSTTINLFDAEHKEKYLKFTQRNKIGKWQIEPVKISAPFIIHVNKNYAELGGIWLQRYKTSGVIVSMTGTNGAKQSIWQKWSPNWYDELAATNSDMIILEYGTNESFESMLDLSEYRQNLVENIRKIRKTLPKAVVLLISPPDTMLKTVKSDNIKERRPPNYYQIRHIQQQVAKQEKTLYWDWQTAMGGEGIIEKWLLLDLARPDLVHLTKKGYIESAKIFYNDLMAFTK